MRFRPTSLKPHPVDRPQDHRILLRPGHQMQRGRMAKRGHVAWGQPSNAGWYEFARYNTVRPFFGMKMPICWWRKVSHDPLSYDRASALLEWMVDMEQKRDWREVAVEKIEELEAVAQDFYEFGKWNMSGGNEGKAPYGSKRPYPPNAQGFMRACADIRRCTNISRQRIEETKTLAVRRKIESNQLSRAIDAAEAEKRMAEWDKKVAPSV